MINPVTAQMDIMTMGQHLSVNHVLQTAVLALEILSVVLPVTEI
jgi:hypothetical protein